jgi:8-oxo-dGTP diphosphatase
MMDENGFDLWFSVFDFGREVSARAELDDFKRRTSKTKDQRSKTSVLRVLSFASMLRDLAESAWRRAPKVLRRWSVRLTNARFTVTAAGIISNSEDRVLLLKHRFRTGSGWGIPGGFIEADEQPEEGLRRELREEIGLELQTVRLYKARTFKGTRQIEIIFYGRTEGVATPQSQEIKKAGWFALDSLPEGLPPDQRHLIKDVLQSWSKT